MRASCFACYATKFQVPYLNELDSVFGGKLVGVHMGPSITLPPSEPGEVNFSGLGVLHEQYYMQISQPGLWTEYALFAHSMKDTRDKLKSLLRRLTASGLTALPDTGFDDGSWCRDDAECSSFQEGNKYGPSTTFGCVSNRCSSGAEATRANGESCEYGYQCKSGRCDVNWWMQTTCMPLLGRFSVCSEDSDCRSGSCSWFWTCD